MKFRWDLQARTQSQSEPRLRLELMVCFVLLLCRTTCRVSVPLPGVEPVPPPLEAWSLNHWTTRAVLTPWFSPCLYNRRDIKHISSLQFSPVAQSCLTLCDPMNHSTPGLPVHHQLPEFTQTHVHRVSDAIQPSHPLSSPSPTAPNPSQHQRLFQ